jgi:prolyl-tRNA synthetase
VLVAALTDPAHAGCYIFRPWSYKIWEEVSKYLSEATSAMDVDYCYFPMFVSEAALHKEAEHIEDFAPEVAWVTRSGKTDLEKPLAIRPTSETIMYPAFAKWIRSHRDLPLRLVQACNVVRWEFKSPTPFLRTREFLWQEGHTAWANKEDADAEVLEALDMYARVYEEMLAVPVVKGRKSHKEKFAGGDFTTTVEAFIPAAGKAIQGATSHSLGQNFAKMFDITYTGGEGEADAGGANEPKYVWQNSWGITTRVLGVMIMVHGDNMGLVLPPKVAPTQLVCVYIYSSHDGQPTVDSVKASAGDAVKALKRAGVRAHLDDRDRTAGFKFSYWEQKGVPLRMEVGPRDVETRTCVLVRRDTGEKLKGVPLADVCAVVPELLVKIQADMLARARQERDSRISIAWSWAEFRQGLALGNLVLAPWCCTTETEEWVKEETSPAKNPDEVEGGKLSGSAKTLCVPFNQPPMPKGTPCFTGQGGLALSWTLWGRSY